MQRLALAVLGLAIACTAQAGLQVSPNGRYLVGSGGQPFLLNGDAAWSLVSEPTREEAVRYLDDRAARGFNLVMVRLIDHQFCANPPANAYGQVPFTGAPFTTPNDAYFAYVDDVISLAAQRGIVVLLAPVYLGYECGSQGWCAEVESASLADMRAWGRYLGTRYAGVDNIVWLIGGDTDPSPVAAKVREVVLGIREHDTVHLITCHNQTESQAITPWPGEAWIGINNIYTYSPSSYVKARDAYQVSPARPFFLIEAHYENEHGSTPQTLRAQSYWTVLAGGFGHVFGNCPIWHFGFSAGWCGLDDWAGELDDPGSTNMTWFRRLFESRHWSLLVPDFGNAVITAGAGSWGSNDYAMAAFTRDGSSLIAYLPSSRAVTVAMNTLAGTSVRAWWYAPASGLAQLIGTYPKATRTFTPPTSGDWVLVVDDAALNLPAPGTPVAPAPVAEPEATPRLRLERIEPNPSGGSTLIRYLLAGEGALSAVVLGIDGRRVRHLYEGVQSAGAHSLVWDGKDSRGNSVGTGTYLVRLETSGGFVTAKSVRLE